MDEASVNWENSVIAAYLDSNNWDQAKLAWDEYDRGVVAWENANPLLAEQRKLSASGQGLSEKQVEELALSRVVKRITDRDGIFVNPNDVVSDYPNLVAEEVVRIREEIVNVVPDVSEPTFPRPTGKRPEVKTIRRPESLPKNIDEEKVLEKYIFDTSGAGAIALENADIKHVQGLSNAVKQLDKFRLEQGGFETLIRHILGNATNVDEGLIARWAYFMDQRLNAMSLALRDEPISFGEDMAKEVASMLGVPRKVILDSTPEELIPIIRQFNRFHFALNEAGEGYMIDVSRQGNFDLDFRSPNAEQGELSGQMRDPSSGVQNASDYPSLYSDMSNKFTLAPYAYMDVSSFYGLEGAGVKDAWQYLYLDTDAGKVKTYGASPSQTGVGDELADRAKAASRIHGGDVGEGGDNFYQWAEEDRLMRLALKKLYDPNNVHQIDMDDPFFWEKIENLAGLSSQYSLGGQGRAIGRSWRQSPREVIPTGDRSLDILDRQPVSEIDNMIRYLLKDFFEEANVSGLFGDSKWSKKKAAEEIEKAITKTMSKLEAAGNDVSWYIHLPEAGYGHWASRAIVTNVDEGHNPIHRILMNNFALEDKQQLIHDRLNKANAIQALISARALMVTSPFMQKFPLAQKLGFRETFEFLAWRDLKYRNKVRSPVDNYIGGVSLLEDDLAEYLMKVDPANPHLTSDNIDSKMLSYVYANQLLGRVEARDMINAKKVSETVMPRLVESWKVSLVGDGYIAVATPTRSGNARVFNQHADGPTGQFDADSARRQVPKYQYDEDAIGPMDETMQSAAGKGFYRQEGGVSGESITFGEARYPMSTEANTMGNQGDFSMGLRNKQLESSGGTFSDDWIVDLQVIDNSAIRMNENAFELQLADVNNAKIEMESAIADAAMDVRNRILRIWAGIGTTNQEVDWLKHYMGSPWVDKYLGNWLRYADSKGLEAGPEAAYEEAQRLADEIAVRVRDEEILRSKREKKQRPVAEEQNYTWDEEAQQWFLKGNLNDLLDLADSDLIYPILNDPTERLIEAFEAPIRNALDKFSARMDRNDLWWAYLEDIGINYQGPLEDRALTILESSGWKARSDDQGWKEKLLERKSAEQGEMTVEGFATTETRAVFLDALASVVEREVYPEEWFEVWMRWRVNPNTDTARDYLEARLRNALRYDDNMASKVKEINDFYMNPDMEKVIDNRTDLFPPNHDGVQRSVAQQEAAVQASRAQEETAESALLRARTNLEDAKSRFAEIPERILQLKDVEEWLMQRSELLQDSLASLQQLRLSFASATDSVMTAQTGAEIPTIPRAGDEFYFATAGLKAQATPEELINDIDLSIRHLAQKDADLIDEIVRHVELGTKEYNKLFESPIDGSLPSKMKQLGVITVRKHISGQQPVGTGGGMSSGSLVTAMKDSEEAISAALTNKGWVQHYDKNA